MKVSIARTGTLVPIVTTTELDSAALAPPEATKLAELVAGAGIGGPDPVRGPIQPDRGSLRITVDDGPTQASMAAPDADLPAGGGPSSIGSAATPRRPAGSNRPARRARQSETPRNRPAIARPGRGAHLGVSAGIAVTVARPVQVAIRPRWQGD